MKGGGHTKELAGKVEEIQIPGSVNPSYLISKNVNGRADLPPPPGFDIIMAVQGN